MLLLELNNVVKYYGDRLIFRVKDLKVYTEDKIGVVGLNGAGKTTLLDIVAGQTAADEGQIKVYSSYAYINQFEIKGAAGEIDRRVAAGFNLPATYRETLSGGEKTRFRIADALSRQSQLLLADEPTANLDRGGIEQLEASLKAYPGAILLVSHDRELMDNLCTKILDVADGKIKLYSGNYTSYLAQKAAERERQEFMHTQFVKEKAKLFAALHEKQAKSAAVRKAPRRMGNSEARLHKMGNQRAKANIDRAAKAIESRIEKLVPQAKPPALERIKLDFRAQDDLHCKIILTGEDLYKAYGSKVIFKGTGFKLYNGERTAIIGDNGCGKTTLIEMIINRDRGIAAAQNLRIGYFSQQLDILDAAQTVLDNVKASSIHPEAEVRTLLARLLFKNNDVYKKAGMLSGGEQVRAAIGKIILSDYNLLILDEPTNYLDLFSLEAVEEVLAEYTGNLLFVSHDRRFVNRVATNLLLIEGGRITQFQGNLQQYQAKLAKQGRQELEEEKLRLEHRLTELLSRLSQPAKNDDVAHLDREYQQVLCQIKELKSK